mgnify:CR=1 FL=1
MQIADSLPRLARVSSLVTSFMVISLERTSCCADSIASSSVLQSCFDDDVRLMRISARGRFGDSPGIVPDLRGISFSRDTPVKGSWIAVLSAPDVGLPAALSYEQRRSDCTSASSSAAKYLSGFLLGSLSKLRSLCILILDFSFAVSVTESLELISTFVAVFISGELIRWRALGMNWSRFRLPAGCFFCENSC